MHVGTICILFGLILFLLSLAGGVLGANWLCHDQIRYTLKSLPSDAEIYMIFIGVCGFIGLLLCLNLVMHGLTYNKVQQLLRKKKDSRRD